MYGRRHQRKRSFKRVVVTLLTFVMLISVCFPGLQARAEGEDEIVLSETAQNYYDQLKELRSAMAGKSASDPDYQYAFAQFVLLSDKINTASATGSISQAEAEYLSDIINSALPSPEVNQPEQSEEHTSEASKTE